MPKFPIWDDVRTFDGTRWRGHVDVISGGFPCQDISCAGKGAGIDGERSGLWGEFARIIGEVGPRFVFVENVSALVVRGLDRVLGDLSTLGYDARWGIVSAADAGAPHRRERVWIVAESDGESAGRAEAGREAGQGSCECNAGELADAMRGRCERTGELPEGESISDVTAGSEVMADAEREGLEGQRADAGQSPESESWNGSALEHAEGERERAGLCEAGEGRERRRRSGNAGWWDSEPCVGRVANGVASRVDRLRALGNGQVPGVAALAWRILSKEED